MLLFTLASAAVSTLISCGGGGGSNGTTSAASAPQTYTAAAMAGELVNYTVDPTAKTYSYTIVESQFGLTGKTGTGTLIANSDGSFTPSNDSNARVRILPNGLLLGVIRENFGSGLATSPVIGMSNPDTSLASIAGTYNYVGRGCTTTCGTVFGTIQVSASGTWTFCGSGNLTAGACVTGSTGTGSMTALGGGKFQLNVGATTIGTAIAFNSAGENVMIVDLKDPRTPAAGGLGKGIIVGSSQLAINTASTDGKWLAMGTNGSVFTFTAAGSTLTAITLNGAPATGSSTITANSPWTGIGLANTSGHGILAGNGVYAYEKAGYAEIGIKLN